jgi:hypothetical protein
MIRAFAIGLGIATMRLIFVPALFFALDLEQLRADGPEDHGAGPVAFPIQIPALPEPVRQQIAALSILSFSVAFVLHSGLAEVWIRSTRRRGAPGAAANGSRLEARAVRRRKDSFPRSAETP